MCVWDWSDFGLFMVYLVGWVGASWLVVVVVVVVVFCSCILELFVCLL